VLVSTVAVRGFPLEVLVGATEAAVFAPWHSEASRIFLRTVLTSAAMLALIALAHGGSPGARARCSASRGSSAR